jgi:hypothetical protein
MVNAGFRRRVRTVFLMLAMLLLAPASGAWSPPSPIDREWIVTDLGGWNQAGWESLRDEGLEPLRQLSRTEMLVWGGHGERLPNVESVLRGPLAEAYLVVLEPRLPSEAQTMIFQRFDVSNLQSAGTGSALPTTFEVHGVEPNVFDSIPGVWWVEPLLETTGRNALTASIFESNQMTGHPAWDLGLNGSGVILGVADSGIEMDHGCFRNDTADIGVIGPGHRKVVLLNTTIDDQDRAGQDDHKHGTHIAGTLACAMVDGNLSTGTSIAHGAKLLFQDVVNASGWSEPSVDWLLAEALSNGVVIHSDSWGDATESYTLRSSEFDRWHREVPWSLAFIAPGNNPNRFYEPANARNVVSVGGAQHDDSDDLYSASSHGPSEEGLRGNFVVAPAPSILSANADDDLESYNDDMRQSTGTSMSTPAAAAFTGVLQQMIQEGWVRGDGELVITEEGVPRTSGFVPSGAQLRALLALSSEDLDGGQQGGVIIGPAPDPLQGWGRPNLANIIEFGAEDPTSNVWIHDSFRMEEEHRSALISSWLSGPGDRPLEQVGAALWNGSGASGPFLGQGEIASWTLALSPGANLDVILSFDQRPFGSLTDDLDLRVVLPSGQVISSGDPLEGTEAVSIKADELIGFDVVTIEVHAATVGLGNHTGSLGVDGGRVGFALAARGIQRTDAVPYIPHVDQITVNGVTKVRALYNQSYLEFNSETPTEITLNGSQIQPYLSIERDLGTPLNIRLSLEVEGDWSGVIFTPGTIQGHDALVLQCVDSEGMWKIEDGVIEIELEDVFIPVLVLPGCAANGPAWISGNFDVHIDEMEFEQMRLDLYDLMEFVLDGSDNDRVSGYRVLLDLSSVEMPWWNSSGAREGAPMDLTCSFMLYGTEPLPCELAFSEGLLLFSDSRGAVLDVRFEWIWGGHPLSSELPLMILSAQPIRAVDGLAASASGPPLLSPGAHPDDVRIETTAWVPPGGWPLIIEENGQPPVILIAEANTIIDHATVDCGDVWVSTPTTLPPFSFDHAGTTQYEQGNVTLWIVNLSSGEMIQEMEDGIIFWNSDIGGNVVFPVDDVEQALIIPGPDCGASDEVVSLLPGVEGGVKVFTMVAGFLLALILTLFFAARRVSTEQENGVPDPFVKSEEE